MLRDHIQQRETADMWTDASGSIGCGAWIPASCEWLQLRWQGQMLLTPQIAQEGITLKELLPIVLACAVWGRYWAGGVVKAHCDNTGAVAVVNSGYSRSEPIMHLLRCLFFIKAHFQMEVWATHTPGVQNDMADAISRDNLHYFFSQAPGIRHRRVEIPPPLLALLVEQAPDWTSPTWAQLFRSSFPLV